MNDMVSIVLVNHKTKSIVQACLEAIAAHTQSPHETIVVDNDSGDDSLEYLRSIDWITLVECRDVPEGASEAHAAGLDAGIDAACPQSKYVVVIHSDTIIKKDGWLGDILRHIQSVPNAAVVASRTNWSRSQPDVKFYPSTDLMLLDKAALRTLGIKFSPIASGCVGKSVIMALLQAGYVGAWMWPTEKRRLIWHMMHGTSMLRQEGLKLGRGSHVVSTKPGGKKRCIPCEKAAARKEALGTALEKAKREGKITNIRWLHP